MRIFLAATEDLYRVRPERRVSLNIRNLLLSFNGSPNRLVRAHAAAGPPRAYCVDSGAHFAISDWYKRGVKATRAETDAFLQRLLAELHTLPTPPLFVVELDLQDLYGVAAVETWRQLWRAAEATLHAPVCYVWHPSDGVEAWDALLADPAVRWLGVGGRIAFGTGKGSIQADMLRRMVFAAYRAGKPVHGFAQVKDRVMKYIPFASVDATSWGSGVLYGVHTSFDPATGRLVNTGVGRVAQGKSMSRVQGELAIRTRGRLGVGHYSGTGKATSVETISAVYQETANAYEAYEGWITAWWKSQGVDWSTVPGA